MPESSERWAGEKLLVQANHMQEFLESRLGPQRVKSRFDGKLGRRQRALLNNPPIYDKTTGATISGAIIVVKFVLGDHGRTIHTVVISLTPPGVNMPAPALIRSEGYKLGKVRQDWD